MSSVTEYEVYAYLRLMANISTPLLPAWIVSQPEQVESVLGRWISLNNIQCYIPRYENTGSHESVEAERQWPSGWQCYITLVSPGC
jgi:hypothetical protein